MRRCDVQLSPQAEHQAATGEEPSHLPYPTRALMPTAPSQEAFAHLYPSLGDYMGLELTPELVKQLEDQEKQLAVQQQQVGSCGDIIYLFSRICLLRTLNA